MKIEIKCKITQKVLFSSNIQNNTLKLTIERAIIENADLSGADLRWANLSKTDLRWADLRWANLRWANLSKTDLRWANLSWANLSGANLSKTDLRWADLSKADLSGADLSNIKNIALSDHNLLSQILFNNAKNTQQREWAGLVKISTDWCWKDFIKNMTDPCLKWCSDILGQWPNFKTELENHI